MQEAPPHRGPPAATEARPRVTTHPGAGRPRSPAGHPLGTALASIQTFGALSCEPGAGPSPPPTFHSIPHAQRCRNPFRHSSGGNSLSTGNTLDSLNPFHRLSRVIITRPWWEPPSDHVFYSLHLHSLPLGKPASPPTLYVGLSRAIGPSSFPFPTAAHRLARFSQWTRAPLTICTPHQSSRQLCGQKWPQDALQSDGLDRICFQPHAGQLPGTFSLLSPVGVFWSSPSVMRQQSPHCPSPANTKLPLELQSSSSNGESVSSKVSAGT